MKWIIIAIVVLIVLVILFTVLSKKRKDAHREEAAQLREEAQGQQPELRDLQARAAQSRAEADQLQAEAEQKQAEAERMNAEADKRETAYRDAQREHDEQLRKADQLDPDVRTNADGYRLDDERDDNRDAEGGGELRGEPQAAQRREDTAGGAPQAAYDEREVRTETVDERAVAEPTEPRHASGDEMPHRERRSLRDRAEDEWDEHRAHREERRAERRLHDE